MLPASVADIAPQGPAPGPSSRRKASHAYGISEIAGSSPEGIEAAVNNAVAQANKTVRNPDWFEVQDIRGHLAEGKVADWQVTIKLGIRFETA